MVSKSPGCSDPAYSCCSSRGRECLLCGAKDTQMMQYSNTNIKVKTFLMQHFNGIIFGDSWICKKHVLEAQRHCSASGFLPKWCKFPKQPPKKKLANSSCTNTEYQKLIKPAFASIDKIKSVLQLEVDKDNAVWIMSYVLLSNIQLTSSQKNLQIMWSNTKGRYIF